MLVIRDDQIKQMPAANNGPVVTPCDPHWIEIYLADDQGNPVPGAPYEIQLSDGTTVSGNLDTDGHARRDYIPAGQCLVSFPQIDSHRWSKAG